MRSSAGGLTYSRGPVRCVTTSCRCILSSAAGADYSGYAVVPEAKPGEEQPDSAPPYHGRTSDMAL